MDGRGAALARVIAWSVAAVSVLAVVVAFLIQARLPGAWRPSVPSTPDHAAGLAFPLVGAFVVSRRPRLIVGWLMCAGGFFAGVSVLAGMLMFHAAGAGSMDAAGVLRIASGTTWAFGGGILAVLVPLLAPDGRLPSPRWRVHVVVSMAVFASLAFLLAVRPKPAPGALRRPAVIPNPLKIEALAPIHLQLYEAAYLAMEVCVVVALFALVARLRGGDPATRRQIAWPLVTFAVYIVFLLLGDDYWAPAVLWTALIPVAVMVSVLRYRLFGIDTVISRAFVAAGLITAVSGVYFGVGAVSSLLVAEYHQVAGLAAALFAGAFFQPMRRSLQRAVDRLMYGPVGDPRLLAERLTQEVRRADPAEALGVVVEVVRDGLAVDGVAVRVTGGLSVESGDIGASPREIALVWHGEPVGRLLIGRPGARRFAAAHDERVIATLLPYVADVAHATRMAADLQRSRERILAAREEERRRLRRDLHDGLGQTLGAMAMTINIARISIKRAPGTADDLLKDLHSGMEAVTGDIRELVYGLRPPALDDLGLAEAVRQLAEATLSRGDEAGTAVEVVVDGELGDLPAAVEVAAYRIAQEAVTNVRRHAGASMARIALVREAALFVVSVEDDGVGLRADGRAGVGTSSMRERAAELGGSCVVTSRPGGGTLVEARLPTAALLAEPGPVVSARD
ncbi:sensor histidine kinase [Nonomuraea sp. NPDC049152]|uniref:sensor histidine kinase n=1 Tax=Nonomuraea sp. NPDC049152 TaxID=3154350 RepID=UPI0034086689